MIILGIDPGYARIGYGVLEKNLKSLSLIDSGIITTSKDYSFTDRLMKIQKDLDKLLKKHKPDLVAIEKLFFFKNAKTAFGVGQAWGVILLTVAKQKIPIVEQTPLQIKQSVTGYGQANKEQLHNMLKIIFKISSIPKPDDIADGIACAFCAAQKTRNISRL
ncbi:crossover junction endodeoxyribonuclease RuvC [Patescibacteria group bacterium]|nr:crossover junction endodeoxyribonuclease RuvC [Patescibacteria group bacterium]MBU1890571.1 crossover junction endodeoxyribonuclease RuvC [Patescibacteria group bacterium]